MNEREMLLKRLQVCDFALNDAALYLNIHPEDQIALRYYSKYQAMREEANRDFVSKYGPVTRNDYSGGDRWEWADNPWPWQNEEV